MGEVFLRRRRVLVVEDDPGIREMLTVALDAEGYEVQVVGDGRQALGASGRNWRRGVLSGAALLALTRSLTAGQTLAHPPYVSRAAGRHSLN